jgi:single-strand DNA-binding protein
MNIVVLSGRLLSDPSARELPSGDVIWSLDLASEVTAADPPCSLPVPIAWPGNGVESWAKGTELVVSGVVRRRFFRAGGGTQSRTEVVADRVVEVTRRRPLERALATVLSSLGEEDRSRLRSQLG